MRKTETKPSRSERPCAVRHSPESIASTLKLDKGLGFLVRLLDTRFKNEYERLRVQVEITPRQFGVLLTLHQQGTLTLMQLARHIRIDRSTLGEMISRMEERSLIIRSSHSGDRRSAKVSLATIGKNALLGLVSGVSQLQDVLLAPLRIEDRRHFVRS